jgi:HTH-type transcriptional regulator/antitoxin HipB
MEPFYTHSRILTFYTRSRILFPMDMIARTAKQVGAAIRRYRRQRQLTQNALAARTNTRQATISKLEAGEPATQLQTLMDALAALDLELVVRHRSKASIEDIETQF